MGINQAALARFLTGPNGPVAREIKRVADGIAERAYDNASGRFLDRKTGRLLDGVGGGRGIHVEMTVVNGEVQARVGSDAVDPKNGESYPGFWNATTRPWLDTALRDEMIYGFQRRRR